MTYKYPLTETYYRSVLESCGCGSLEEVIKTAKKMGETLEAWQEDKAFRIIKDAVKEFYAYDDVVYYSNAFEVIRENFDYLPDALEELGFTGVTLQNCEVVASAIVALSLCDWLESIEHNFKDDKLNKMFTRAKVYATELDE